MNFIKEAESKIVTVMKNEYVYTALCVFFVLYGGLLAPNPGPMFATFMNNSITKFVLITVLVLAIKTDIRLALIVATTLVLGTRMLNREGFSDFKKDYKSNTASRILEATNHVNYKCLGMTMAQLLAAFDGDASKLQVTLKQAFKELLQYDKSQDSKQRLTRLAHFSGLPYNVEFNDENAPYIATILAQWGFDFGNGCSGV